MLFANSQDLSTFLFRSELFDRGADVGFPREGFVLARVVGGKVWNRYAKLIQQFGCLGERAAVHIRLSISPGRLVGFHGVVLSWFEISDGPAEECECVMRGIA